ncbi:hypothetical protein Hanom_Chr11g00987371 [Helianthus anomalus]
MPEMESVGVEAGESEKEDDRLHGDYVDSEGVHGENNKSQGAANMSHSPSILERTCGKGQSLFDLIKSIGSFSVGSSKVEPEIRSRKRPRRCRSPRDEEVGMGQEDGSAYNPLHELIKKSKVNEEVPNPNTFIGVQDNGNFNGGESAAQLGLGSGGRGSRNRCQPGG